MSTHCGICFGQGHTEESCDSKPSPGKTYYVLVVKNRPKGAYAPTYEIRTEKPTEGKFVGLGPGDCVDAFKCYLSTDDTYIDAHLYHITNIDGTLTETLTETFQMNRP